MDITVNADIGAMIADTLAGEACPWDLCEIDVLRKIGKAFDRSR